MNSIKGPKQSYIKVDFLQYKFLILSRETKEVFSKELKIPSDYIKVLSVLSLRKEHKSPFCPIHLGRGVLPVHGVTFAP